MCKNALHKHIFLCEFLLQKLLICNAKEGLFSIAYKNINRIYDSMTLVDNRLVSSSSFQSIHYGYLGWIDDVKKREISSNDEEK